MTTEDGKQARGSLSTRGGTVAGRGGQYRRAVREAEAACLVDAPRFSPGLSQNPPRPSPWGQSPTTPVCLSFCSRRYTHSQRPLRASRSELVGRKTLQKGGGDWGGGQRSI